MQNNIWVALITVVGSIITTLGAIYLNRRVNGSATTEMMRLRQENARLKKKL